MIAHQELIDIVRDAFIAYETGRRDDYLNTAMEFFIRKKNRIVFWENQSVETWWDRYSRNYITQLKDKDNNQIDDATYSGNKWTAASAHFHMLRKLFHLDPSQ